MEATLQQVLEALTTGPVPIKLATIPSVFLLFYMVFSMILGVVLTVYVVRLSSVDASLEKVVLLLTVLANKQGATEEDIKKALEV